MKFLTDWRYCWAMCVALCVMGSGMLMADQHEGQEGIVKETRQIAADYLDKYIASENFPVGTTQRLYLSYNENSGIEEEICVYVSESEGVNKYTFARKWQDGNTGKTVRIPILPRMYGLTTLTMGDVFARFSPTRIELLRLVNDAYKDKR